MHPNLLQNSFHGFILLLFLASISIRSSLCRMDFRYSNCSEPYACGKISNISFPFWGANRAEYCGLPAYELGCESDVPTIAISSERFRVLDINLLARTITVAREDLWNNSCPPRLINTTINFQHFSYGSVLRNLTLFYGCPFHLAPVPGLWSWRNCTINVTTSTVYYATTSMTIDPNAVSCDTSVGVPVFESAAQALEANLTSIGVAIDAGFGLQWSTEGVRCIACLESGGVCGYNRSESEFTCFCRDQPHNGTCQTGPGDGSGSDSMSMQIGLPIAGAVIAGIGLGWAIFACRQKRKRVAAESAQAAESKDIVSSAPLTKGLTTTPSTNLSHSIPSYRSSKSEFGKASTYFGAQIFSYAELEEATNYFDPSRELGDGGFGTVYYGKLQDGRIVAVKRLYENNFKRVEQFMNEVEILTRLRHVNLVTLYGCTSKRSRELLLVYEFIPNGTVADHLHGRKSNSGLLSWPVRLGIAMETAEALAYLHASDIIHRDVKTNNILLDNDFHVKVADFGLSRLFPNDVTHVSTAPQGTPGYVDPEYYQCYQLTERSDVYSFGVVLIELISSKQAVDTNRDRQEINLANMAINKIQNHTLNELVDPDLGFETNSSVRRMATLVAELAFRCLQMERDMRPSMEEVLKALKRIKNEEMNGGQDAEVVDIVIEDDVGLLKGNPPPLSPDSTATDKRVSNSYTSFSSG
ncbi:LEAF RUST 10 DISEASE-RESISTANCE LOCUS RECEPTOR-LIKE PROTEIN KINASE-like 1.2 isoform X3 [Diospyros lotus]|uniref:LEAF RUST 10 DISEASE-RESISTANCE LOCUS RECEPTOR-LIKE PROTEIN KINASE-like 1.2 isoform X3 n=1 Tax=Diospyros lotus TaxID=55363 RepID=UPI00225B416A|nr:LEAF RUST 10 DISEASE-RESISTANCE LOCUS RECEPTOR-LIKE PROTEIN KINASE-like 1.2 isoform X3 [Diospyros lotus]